MNYTKLYDHAIEKAADGTYSFRIWRNTRKAPYFEIKAEGIGFADIAQAKQAAIDTAHDNGLLLRNLYS